MKKKFIEHLLPDLIEVDKIYLLQVRNLNIINGYVF